MNLEENVISTVHSAITEAIKTKLSGYNSPLDKLIESAINKNQLKIQATLDSAIEGCLNGDFGNALVDASSKKLAKCLISKMEGEIEKRANELRSSPEFRAKLTLAITQTLNHIQ